jgi:peptidoglycan/LPS O-acetylase OafA/YrhL
VLTLFLLWFVGAQISLYFLIWLGGALVGYLQRGTRFKSPSPALPLAGGLIFIGALAWSRTHRISSDLAIDYIVAFCFALWLYTLLLGSRDDASPAYAYGAKKLAGFSYTLYLTHFPALLLLRAWLNPLGAWQPDLRHLLYALGIGLLMLCYAYVLAEFTESRTATVRDRLIHSRVPIESKTHS